MMKLSRIFIRLPISKIAQKVTNLFREILTNIWTRNSWLDLEVFCFLVLNFFI